MKSIQSINLFFTDNFNRYIDNILVCELIDAFLDFNEFVSENDKTNSNSLNNIHLDMINIKYEEIAFTDTILKNLESDNNINIPKNSIDILSNLEYKELSNDDINNFDVYKTKHETHDNIVKLEISDNNQEFLNKIVTDYFGNEIDESLEVKYYDESSNESDDYSCNDLSSDCDDTESLLSKSPSMCSIFTNNFNDVNVDCNTESFEKYKDKLTQIERELLLEFIYDKIRHCPNKEVIKYINNNFKFVHKMSKIKVDLIEPLAKFKEYINSYKHKDIFNSYSKHFIKNLINITNNLTSDYVQAHRLYNYSIIKNLSNKPLITNVGVSHSLPLGDTLTKLHLIVDIDNNKYSYFNLSNFNEFYPNYFCNTCIITNNNKIKCSHVKVKPSIYELNYEKNIDALDGTFFEDKTPVLKSRTGHYTLKDYYITFFKERYAHLLSKDLIYQIYEKYNKKIKANEYKVHVLVTTQLYKIIKSNIDIKEYKNIYDIIYKDYKKYWINVIKK